MKLIAIVISSSLIILLASGASAQATGTNPGVGFPSFGSFAGSEFDTVNPLGNVNIINFGKDDKFESKRQVYTGSSTLLETVETCYNGAAFPCTGTTAHVRPDKPCLYRCRL